MSRKEIVSAVFDNKFMRAQTLYRLKKKTFGLLIQKIVDFL